MTGESKFRGVIGDYDTGIMGGKITSGDCGGTAVSSGQKAYINRIQ